MTSVSGDISIGEAYDNVNANSVSGDQDHGAVMQGVVAAHSVSGDVHDRRPPRLEGIPRLHDGQRRHDVRARADE